MKDLIKVFNNSKFGEVRTVGVNGKIYFVGSDVAKALGYDEPHKAIARHCRGGSKHPVTDSLGRSQQMNIIPEGDLYRLVANSQLPSAQEFESWIFDEVLPSIRKTGTYSISDTKQKELSIKELNAKARIANQWHKIAQRTNIPEWKNICFSKVAEVLEGKKILPLPEASEQTLSATEVGVMVGGISKTKVGMLANKHNLKTAEYGKLFYDKSPHSNKEVETFRYYPCVVPILKQILEREGA